MEGQDKPLVVKLTKADTGGLQLRTEEEVGAKRKAEQALDSTTEAPAGEQKAPKEKSKKEKKAKKSKHKHKKEKKNKKGKEKEKEQEQEKPAATPVPTIPTVQVAGNPDPILQYILISW